jgi:steroid delta-isomerase-like uncharacterized protein
MDLNESVVRRFYDELWNQWQLELVDELLAPNVRFRGSRGAHLTGRDAFRRYAESTRAGFPDWKNRIDEILAIDDRVVTRLTWTGTHTGEFDGIAPTGARVEYVGAAFFRLEEALITEAWVVGDSQAFWTALHGDN